MGRGRRRPGVTSDELLEGRISVRCGPRDIVDTIDFPGPSPSLPRWLGSLEVFWNMNRAVHKDVPMTVQTGHVVFLAHVSGTNRGMSPHMVDFRRALVVWSTSLVR